MAIIDALLPEFDHEMATTRKLLERVPDDKFDWKPHTKSFSMGQLAQHVATLPRLGRTALTQAEVDMAEFPQPAPLTSRAEVLAAFDTHVAETRTAITGASDAEMMAPWTLKRSGQVIFSMPVASVWRSMFMNHVIHHRGQLSVYLRLNDVPVPSMYGPSADEAAF
jgi:uncharacterized damage-inducible protein DinB